MLADVPGSKAGSRSSQTCHLRKARLFLSRSVDFENDCLLDCVSHAAGEVVFVAVVIVATLQPYIAPI